MEGWVSDDDGVTNGGVSNHGFCKGFSNEKLRHGVFKKAYRCGKSILGKQPKGHGLNGGAGEDFSCIPGGSDTSVEFVVVFLG